VLDTPVVLPGLGITPLPPPTLLMYTLFYESILLGLYDSEERAEEAKKFFPTIDLDEFVIEKREVNKVYAVKEGQRLYHCRIDFHGDIKIDWIDPTRPWIEEAGLVNFSTGECAKMSRIGGFFSQVVLWAKDKSEARRVFNLMLGEE
jgi:hypothetical protein